MDDDQDELVFTSDCIVNLDDFGEMEDYAKLISELHQMVDNKKIDQHLLKRLFDSETDYLCQQEGIVELLNKFLCQIQTYRQYREHIFALLFQISEEFMFSDTISQQLIHRFLQKLCLPLSDKQVLMLLYYLKRIGHKLIYFNEEEKKDYFLKFFYRLVQQKIENNEQYCRLYIEIIDRILRFKDLRNKLEKVTYEFGSSQNILKAIFCLKLSTYSKNIKIVNLNGLKNSNSKVFLNSIRLALSKLQ